MSLKAKILGKLSASSILKLRRARIGGLAPCDAVKPWAWQGYVDLMRELVGGCPVATCLLITPAPGRHSLALLLRLLRMLRATARSPKLSNRTYVCKATPALRNVVVNTGVKVASPSLVHAEKLPVVRAMTLDCLMALQSTHVPSHWTVSGVVSANGTPPTVSERRPAGEPARRSSGPSAVAVPANSRGKSRKAGRISTTAAAARSVAAAHALALVPHASNAPAGEDPARRILNRLN